MLCGFCWSVEAALVWSDGPGFRSAPLTPGGGASHEAGFTLMPARETGVSFTNVLRGDAFLTNAVAHNGSGLAIGDVDGDDRPDIYLCNLEGPNQLYRNLGGWRFEPVPLGAAACSEQLSTGATLADIDGDRDLDLLVNGIAAGTRLFLNDGRARFTEVVGSGLSRTNSPTSMALADIDGDGDLDLYCAHYIDVMHLADPTVQFALARREGKWVVTKVNGQPTTLPRWKDRFEALPDGSVRELPEADALYRNDGQGRFAPIQNERGAFLNEAGAPAPMSRDWGLAAMFRDLNGDGAPDLYVCNDNASPDRIWINSGQGTFRPIDRFALRHTSRSSMGIDIADVNRDGLDDLFVLDMLAREHVHRMTQVVRDRPDLLTREAIEARPRFNRNTLFFGRRDGSYAEAAFFAGVAASDWSWCPVFLDVDLDGYEDLLISNGFSFDVMDQDSHDEMRRRRMTREQARRSRQFHPAWPTPNAAFRNRGDGTFEPASRLWGFDQTGISYGMALGDLDNDGDLDLVVNNLNAPAGLYRNDALAARVAVRLNGSSPNTKGIGARLRLANDSLVQSQEMISGGRYMSGDEALRVFAVPPNATGQMRLEVRWRSGKQSVVAVEPNRIYEIDESAAVRREPSAPPPNRQPHFRDVSTLLAHTHVDAPFDDWARQPLLPRRLSRLGPGVCWFDANGDGSEDLIISSGRSGKLAVCLNENGKSFKSVSGAPAVSGDQGAVVGWPDGRGRRHLLVATAGDEATPARTNTLAICKDGEWSAPETIVLGDASPGPLALADIDSDGDLDLFVGGRFHPGRYPEPVSSAVWLNERGELRWSRERSAPFASIGLVNGATFFDLEGDGDSDLALAIEWGPLRVFRNDAGQFGDITADLGLAGLTGWWTGVIAGDFDGDGRLDLAAGNGGRNSEYELFRPVRLRLFYGDWNGDGSFEILEAWHKEGQWLPVRSRHWLMRGWPTLETRFASHRAFGQATVADIVEQPGANARFSEAVWFESTVFLNRGSRFEARALPAEAQLAPVFSVNVADFDGDGKEDLFLSQNFFGTASDLDRTDAGRGLWLRGLGDGTFAPVDASVSGIRVEGEQRAAAVADFDRDGRADLAVSQNNSTTRLYLNAGAARGLRVVLSGPPGNPEGIGAWVRLIYADGRKGPCRAVQAGSGYASQDGAVQVLGMTERPRQVWVRWPGGQEQMLQVEDQTWEVRVPFAP